MLQEIILQNRNHPSIILWGVRINESVDDDAFYNRTNKIAPPSWTPAAPPPACDTIGELLETQERFAFPSRPHSVEQQTSQTRRSGLFAISK